MRKNCAGLLVGVLAFGIGLVAVCFYGSSFIFNKLPERTVLKSESNSVPKQNLYPTSPNGKIEVIFKGFVKTGQGLLLETEIINHNTKPAKYWSEVEKAPFFSLKLNGKEKDMRWCGTGARELKLLPGESFSPQMSANVLEDFLDKKDNLQIGYHFGFEKNKYQQYWSQNFQIPDEVKTQIKNQIAEQSKHNKN